MNREQCNAFRWDGASGHYESYFQRANHPTEPKAFWIRYTVFVPKGRPADAVGELWAVWFDQDAHEVVAVKEVLPMREASFSERRLDARIGECTLDAEGLAGSASAHGHTLAWDLRYSSPTDPLLLLPPRFYEAPFPKAKALVGSPLARFSGTLTVDGRALAIDDWVGSQNHNWGEKHTDEYAWGQVAGFDDAPDSFLEVSTARVKLGPVFTPWMTLMVLRHEGKEHRLNGLGRAVRAHGKYDFFRWSFSSEEKGVAIAGEIDAAAEDFVGLPYDNPPGGQKTCLNSKVARCRLTLYRPGVPSVTLSTASRAAFEILTDRRDHGVRVLQT
jgi:hypothetical protein